MALRLRPLQRLYNTATVPFDDFDYYMKNPREVCRDDYSCSVEQPKERTILILDKEPRKPLFNIANLDSDTIEKIIKNPHNYSNILSRVNGFELVYNYYN
jgi:hypothetical protein